MRERINVRDSRYGANAFPKSAIILFFVVFFVLSAAICTYFLIDFFKVDKRPDIVYTIGDRKYELSEKEAYSKNGDMMICFDDVARLCDMIITGTSDEKSFYANDSDEKNHL